MSAVPRSAGRPWAVETCKPSSSCASRRSDDPARSGGRPSRWSGRAGRPMCRPSPGFRTIEVHAAYAASRSPSSSRRGPTGRRRHPVRDGRLRRRFERRFGVRHRCGLVPADPGQASAVDGIAAGRCWNAASSETTISAAGRLRERSVATSIQCSASVRRPSTPLIRHGERAPASLSLSAGRTRMELSGRASIHRREADPVDQPAQVAGPPARPGRPPVRSRRRPWRVGSPPRLAFAVVPVGGPPVQLRHQSGSRRAGGPAARPRTGGGSDTSGADRRAG